MRKRMKGVNGWESTKADSLALFIRWRKIK